MSQFYRFLQGVVVAKDKSGAYVPKKYIVRRHGSGYLNGSVKWLNDALDGDYQRLVTEHGLDELYAGKSVHKDFTATSTEDAFHLDALPKFMRNINNVKAYREQYNKEVSEYRRAGASLSVETLWQERFAMGLFMEFDYIAEDKL